MDFASLRHSILLFSLLFSLLFLLNKLDLLIYLKSQLAYKLWFAWFAWFASFFHILYLFSLRLFFFYRSSSSCWQTYLLKLSLYFLQIHRLSELFVVKNRQVLLFWTLTLHLTAEVVLTEREGFEPSVVVSTTPVFKTGAFNHSATSPWDFSSNLLFLYYHTYDAYVSCSSWTYVDILLFWLNS